MDSQFMFDVIKDYTVSAFAITVGHWTISKQISPMCNPSCIWSDSMTEHES